MASNPNNNTDPASVAAAQAAHTAGVESDTAWREQSASGDKLIGTPKQAEIRQVRPVAEEGAGFREVTGGVH
jgi:hypothetical protein